MTIANAAVLGNFANDVAALGTNKLASLTDMAADGTQTALLVPE